MQKFTPPHALRTAPAELTDVFPCSTGANVDIRWAVSSTRVWSLSSMLSAGSRYHQLSRRR